MSKTPDGYSTDQLGMKFTKAPPMLAHTSPSAFADVVEWVKNFVLDDGLEVREAALDPYLEQWNFYGEEGSFLFSLEHSVMERALYCFLGKHKLPRGD